MKRWTTTLLCAILLGCVVVPTALGNPTQGSSAKPGVKLAPARGVVTKPKATKAPRVRAATPSPVTALKPKVLTPALDKLKAPKALSRRAMLKLFAKGSGLDLQQVRARGIAHKARLTPRTSFLEGQAYLSSWYASEYDPQKNSLFFESHNNGVLSVHFMPDQINVPYVVTIAVSGHRGAGKHEFVWHAGGQEQVTEVARGSHNISVTITPEKREWQWAGFSHREGAQGWMVHSVDIHALK